VFSTVSLTQTAADVPKSHQLRRKFEVSAKIDGKWENTETGLAVDAVPCELFSAVFPHNREKYSEWHSWDAHWSQQIAIYECIIGGQHS
jgi:hypothetical protein